MKRRALLQGSLGLLTLAGAGSAVGGIGKGDPVRTVLVEMGPYYRNDLMLRNLFEFLLMKGIVRECPMPLPKPEYDLTEMWEMVSAFASSNRIRFLRDGFYSCGYDMTTLGVVVESLRERINQVHDVDLICSMGVQTSEALVQAFPDVPIIILDDVPNPRAVGLVNADGTLVRRNFHVRQEMNAFSDQIRIFHRYFPFKRLGYAAMLTQANSIDRAQIEHTCRSLGVHFDVRFKRHEVNGKLQEMDHDSWFRWFFDVTRTMVLKDHVDALYLPYFPATDEQFDAFVEFLCEQHIPAFASTGFEPVRRGVLMGMGNRSIADVGAFEAGVIEQYLNGTPLDQIPTRYFCHTSLVLNLKTAMRFGWKPSFDMLTVLEQVYTTHSPMQDATL